MKNIGIVSYNIYANFTNYGSALQSWALNKAVDKYGDGEYHAKLVDYCPEILKDKDILNPIKNMWDTDETSRKMCELSLPAIRVNYEKFTDFYNTKFDKTKKKYDCNNFNEIVSDENLSGFICGSDTIFCVDEFGLDDGYLANYDCMKNGYAVSYAASFGDPHFTEETYKKLDSLLQNFKYLGIRENDMIDYVKSKTGVPVKQVLDPTLLLTPDDYKDIIIDSKEEKYILLYARRYNPKMEAFAEKIAKENNWKIIEISLRATNKEKHQMFYEAGVEEFLGLVKNAEYIVTNSYHGMIFSVLFKKQFVVFTRELCNTKISELLDVFELQDRALVDGTEDYNKEIDYDKVHKIIEEKREDSIKFLKLELKGC